MSDIFLAFLSKYVQFNANDDCIYTNQTRRLDMLKFFTFFFPFSSVVSEPCLRLRCKK